MSSGLSTFWQLKLAFAGMGGQGPPRKFRPPLGGFKTPGATNQFGLSSDTCVDREHESEPSFRGHGGAYGARGLFPCLADKKRHGRGHSSVPSQRRRWEHDTAPLTSGRYKRQCSRWVTSIEKRCLSQFSGVSISLHSLFTFVHIPCWSPFPPRGNNACSETTNATSDQCTLTGANL